VGLVTAITMNWQLCVDKVKVPGAAQAATAAVGVLLIGAALLYAGMGRKNATAARH
jgi:ACS family hexuronate transporter-like MFS transporter